MRAERTSRANWVAPIGKLILRNGPGICAGNRFGLDRYQRIACSRTADHFRAQLVGVSNTSASLLIKKRPEASDVLFQLPYDQIASVTRQIFFRGSIFRVQQTCGGSIGMEQWPICYLSVLVAITEQELAQRDNIGVFQLSVRPFQLLLPIDLRLADAIGKPKRFDSVEIAGAKRRDLLEC